MVLSLRGLPPRLLPLLGALGALTLAPAPLARGQTDGATVHHDLVVKLEPATHRLAVQGTVRVAAPRPADGEALQLVLHKDLALEATAAGWTVEAARQELPDEGEVPLQSWLVRPPEGRWPAEVALPLRWSGAIHHPLESEGEEYARSFSRTAGTIGDDGVVLTRASWWVPYVGEALLTFRLAIDLPEGWDAVSQGARVEHQRTPTSTRVTWDCPHPMEEVYLIANRYVEYTRAAGAVEAQVFLREPDPALAAKYLEATAQYVEMYRRLIGPYPFTKFALVENFWETGYGMPSFTLLGPKVLRFPFILHSSYPHEILHNWWGNSVYVDAASGNWCEGLTAYQADHLIREGQGRGEEYRRDTLKKYRNYVRGARDFPLTEFRSRHSGATEAVGYGKALMVFHMLRRRLGDEAFTQALQAFYRTNSWRSASWSDLARAFSEAAKEDLGPWIRIWTTRPGAPVLAMEAAPGADGILRVTVRQTQAEEPWPLLVPIAVTVDGQGEAVTLDIASSARVATQPVPLPGRAVRVDVDPAFDLFRRLDLAETPPTLSELFGAERVTLVVPAGGEDARHAAWRALADGWRADIADDKLEIVAEDAIEALPADRAVWVLGRANRWRTALAEPLRAYGAGAGEEQFAFGETDVPRADHTAVFVVRHPANADLALGWIVTDVAAALPGLGRKLPHYGKYSFLAFAGTEPENVVKGEWPAAGSPLVVALERDAAGRVPPRGRLPVREPLARLAPVFDAERMLAHVGALADEGMEGRGVGTAGLAKAAAWVAAAFADAGLRPGGDESGFVQVLSADGGPSGERVVLENIVGFIAGTDPALAQAPLIVGAHYDHLGYGWPDVREGNAGQVHNGADDNASGVAVLVEVARNLAREHRPRRPIVFVAFTGEEWGRRGSRHFVDATTRWSVRDAIAMVNVDTVGRLGGQRLLVLGSGSATEWRPIAMGIGYTTGVESLCVPEDPEGSDQVSFAAAGVPAVQLFTGAHSDYHRPTDDVAKIDGAGLVKVATWLREAVVYLADRPGPLTRSTQAGATKEPPAAPAAGRRVSLGTTPDFSYAGPGVKVVEVREASPASAAGIQPGDVILAIDGKEVGGLKAYSDALKRCEPGDVVRIALERDGQRIEVEATLGTR